jgi:hypothetical protein
MADKKSKLKTSPQTSSSAAAESLDTQGKFTKYPNNTTSLIDWIALAVIFTVGIYLASQLLK